MIVTNKEYFINGNAALVPEKKRNNDEYEKLKRDQKENLIKAKKRIQLSRARVMISITMAFILGLTVTIRYAQIYSMQKQLSYYDNQISDLNKNKEDLKLQLVKSSNLQAIEKKATEEFHMIQPNKGQVIFVDMSKNNFKELKKDDEKGAYENIFDKIKNMFF